MRARTSTKTAGGWRGILTVLAFGYFGASTTAQPAPTETSTTSLTMEEVISQVLRNNDRAAAAGLMSRSRATGAAAAGAWEDPMLMLRLQNVPTSFDLREDPMTMAMVGISQTIPYVGQTGLRQEAAEREAAASVEAQKTTELDLVTAARLAYVNLYFQRQQVEQLQWQHELMEQVVASVRGAVTANRAGQEDLLAAQADVWRLESSILSANQQVDAARLELNALRGEEPATEIVVMAEPPMARIDSVPEAWLASARAAYPPLRELDLRAEQQGYEARASRRMGWPMLQASFAYGFRFDGPEGMVDPGHGEALENERDNMLNFGLNLSLPIFSGRAERTMARSMTQMQQATEAEAEQLWRDVAATITTLHRRALRLQESLSLYENKIVPASEDAFRSALGGYEAGRTPPSNLLTYALSVYLDRLTVVQLREELHRTLAEAGRYVTDPATWTQSTDN